MDPVLSVYTRYRDQIPLMSAIREVSVVVALLLIIQVHLLHMHDQQNKYAHPGVTTAWKSAYTFIFSCSPFGTSHGAEPLRATELVCWGKLPTVLALQQLRASRIWNKTQKRCSRRILQKIKRLWTLNLPVILNKSFSNNPNSSS